jgi:hypothetical protein
MGKRTKMLTGLSAAAIAVGVSGAANVAYADRPDVDGWGCQRQFDRAVDTYTRTTHERDAEGWASVLHPEVTAVFAGGDVLYGREATLDWAREFFADPGWTQTFDELTRVVDGCRSGFVLFDSVYTPAPGADPKPLVIGLTFTRERGRWLVLHNQDSNGPAAGAHPETGSDA